MSQERNTIGSWYAEKTASETPGNYTGSLNVHNQEIRFRRGESFNVRVTLTSQHEATRIRFAARLGDGATSAGNTDADCLIQKFSYGSELVANRKEVVVAINRGDTINHPYGPGYRWILEVTSKIEGQSSIAPAMTNPALGTDMLYGKDLAKAVVVGDIVGFAGRTALVTEVGDLFIRADRNDWGKFRGDARIFKSESSTIASGPWICLA